MILTPETLDEFSQTWDDERSGPFGAVVPGPLVASGVRGQTLQMGNYYMLIYMLRTCRLAVIWKLFNNSCLLLRQKH